jgi:leucyl-tRNA synthetase
VFRFLNRIWRSFVHESKISDRAPNEKEERILSQTIKKVAEDIENLRFNTAISQLMICHNELTEQTDISKKIAENFTLILSPFAPHITEELWEIFGRAPSVLSQSWPEYDPKYLVVDEVTYAVQVNGKLRGNLLAKLAATQDEVQKMALEDPNVSKYVKGEIKKVIFVPKRLINFVVAGESS